MIDGDVRENLESYRTSFKAWTQTAWNNSWNESFLDYLYKIVYFYSLDNLGQHISAPIDQI